MVGQNQRHEIRVVAHGDVSLWMEGIVKASGCSRGCRPATDPRLVGLVRMLAAARG
jgi:hypothetical protein